jgi:hypothetical protein
MNDDRVRHYPKSLPSIPEDRTKMAKRSGQDEKMPYQMTETNTLEGIKNRAGGVSDTTCRDQN